MIKSVFLVTALLLFSSPAFAAGETDKLLQCTNSSGGVTFRICGVKGCPTVVTNGDTIQNYNMKRVRNSDLSLTYSPRTGTKPRCTIVISPLKFGIRRIQSISCGSKLKNAVCNFVVPGATPTPTPEADD